jgi:ABC-type multidrug transport system ATPase subunit
MIAFFLLVSGHLRAAGQGHHEGPSRTREEIRPARAERLQALARRWRADVVLFERADRRPQIHGLRPRAALRGTCTSRIPEATDNAVDGLTLEVRPGETLALVGPSGSGKSTLVDLVARFMDPTSGRVTVDGRDLRELTLDSWTAQYAMVGQTPFLFHTTIAENIRYGKPGATQAEIEAAARAAGIHEFILGLPQGYATNVADAGSRLSGGQRQRITIARAFIKDAPLLLLDEATSALDAESEQVVQEALERLMSHRTVVVIAHRLSTIRNADRIAVLERGRLAEIGTHAELLARWRHLRALARLARAGLKALVMRTAVLLLVAGACLLGACRVPIDRPPPPGKPTEVAPIDPRFVQLRGRVLDAQGKPVAGASVLVMGGGHTGARVTTNAAGEFSASGLPSVSEGYVVVRAEGFAVAVREPIAISQRESQSVSMRLEPQQVLAGLVIDAAGTPLERARVEVRGERRLATHLRRGVSWERAAQIDAQWTDAQGHFRFTGLYAGEFEVVAVPPGGAAGSASARARTGEAELELRIDPSAPVPTDGQPDGSP